MQTEKFKVLLYLKRSGLDKSGQAPIMGRVTYGRTMAQFSCKLSCNPDLWNARESRLNGKGREAVITNGKLEQLLLSVQSAYRRLCERGAIFTAADIKEQVQGSMQSQTTFLRCYDLMLEELKMRVGIDLKPISMRIYYSARQHFVAFVHRQFRTDDITFGQITEDFLLLFEQYIKGELGFSQSYFHTLSICLKKACRLAYRKGFAYRLLFDNIKV